MTIGRLELAREFMFGDDVVLLSMDGAGVAVIADALKRAESQGASEVELAAMAHEFIIRPGESEIRLAGDHAVWQLSPDAAREIAEALEALGKADKPGHHYIDISVPADTLVLSKDEYI